MQHASTELRRVAVPFLSGQRETYATVLLGLLLKVYGADVLNWDPATVEAQVKDDFDVLMPEMVYDQLMGLMNAMTTDTVYTSVEAFDQTVNALCRSGLHYDHDAPSPNELGWTAFEIMANDPDPYGNGQSPFAPEIALYCGAVLRDAGLKKAPTTLSFAVMPKWAPADATETPDIFNGAEIGQNDQSDSVDQFVQQQVSTLLSHLSELGIEPGPLLQEQSSALPEESQLDRLLPH